MLRPLDSFVTLAPRRLVVGAALFFGATMGASSVASARSSSDVGWAVAQVFPVALRFVRVDRGCKVTDKDPDAAYISFECEGEPGKPARHGALELYLPDSGRGTRVQLSLSDEPRYVELRFLELFERKLKEEKGAAPPPPTARPASPPPPDAGAR